MPDNSELVTGLTNRIMSGIALKSNQVLVTLPKFTKTRSMFKLLKDNDVDALNFNKIAKWNQ